MAGTRVETKTIAENRKAFHEYFVEESFEAGIELCGTEIKSLRQGGVNLKDAWCTVEDGEMWIKGMHISPYDHGNIFLNRNGESIDEVFDVLKGKIYYAHLKNMMRSRDFKYYLPTHLDAGHIDTQLVMSKLRNELASGMMAIEYACSGDGVIAAKRDMEYVRFLRSWLGF